MNEMNDCVMSETNIHSEKREEEEEVINSSHSDVCTKYQDASKIRVDQTEHSTTRTFLLQLLIRVSLSSFVFLSTKYLN